MKTLLFIENNSVASKEAIEYAVKLAKDLNVNLKFMHIHYPEILYSANLSSSIELLQNPDIGRDNNFSEKQQVEAFMKELKEEGKIDQETNFEFRTGIPIGILKSGFLAGEYDMLAFTNDIRASEMSRYHTLKDVLKIIPCPIWIIPRNYDYEGIGSALYATDYQEQDIEAIRELIRLTEPRLTKLGLVHLTDKYDFSQKIKGIGFDQLVKEETRFGNVAGIIRESNEKKEIAGIMDEIANENGSNLLVTLKENKNVIQRVFYKSFTMKLLKEATRLILVLHRNNPSDMTEENN